MPDLTQKKCLPCEGGVEPLSDGQIQDYLSQIDGWSLQRVDNHYQIEKEFTFKDFKEAMIFVNKVADLAEAEGHHPDIYIHYNQVKLTLWTHAIGGLSENDFIVAAKIDKILKNA